jgi:uncharacterized surface protein with fasciclin (FAS1) repeats
MTRRLAKLGCVLALALATLLATALPANATGTKPKGTTSLAAVLAADGAGFDKNPYDYDILDNAVTTVLKAKPNSPVAVLADGKVALTAFLPTDAAFLTLARELLHKRYKTESAAFAALAGALGVNTIENVLLYHVVPGATITYAAALKANGAVLQTALPEATIKVRVRGYFFVELRDKDKNDRNPFVVQPNINKGNRQIGHGIDRVLRPVNLP